MTSFTLSANTQNLINIARTQGAGSGNINYYNAYKGIYDDLVANGNINASTLYWFSQAGNINRQQNSQSGTGTFIWAYTKAAAASEGVTLTNANLQAASDTIASTVFNQLFLSGYNFSDTGNFSPINIANTDAGSGISFLKSLYPSLSNAVWGGSLFATTGLGDPTYFTDYNINLKPGSRDANALLSGWVGGMEAFITADAGAFLGALTNYFGKTTFDLNAIALAEGSGETAFVTLVDPISGNPVTFSQQQSQAILGAIHKTLHGITSLYNAAVDAVLIQSFALQSLGKILQNLTSGTSGIFGSLTSTNNGWWASLFAGQTYVAPVSPIILDLNGDGVTTTSSNAGIYFDLRNTGFAQKTGWVAPTDGLLVWDRNGNGLIDNGAELFGNYTAMANGATAANGFAALASYDTNADGKITSADAIWNNLKVWVDSNSNGVTDAGELRTLASLGITSLNTAYTDAGKAVRDASANNPEYVGSFTMNGITAAMKDVNFATDSSQTVANTYIATTTAIDALPDLQGQGALYSLHQAMARDATGTLQSLMTQYINATTVADRNTALTQILLNWAGAQGVSPTSRGTFVNAQHLAVLEAAMGRGFTQPGTNPTIPNGNTGPQQEIAYTNFFERMYAELAAQTFLKPFYDEVQTVTDSSGTRFNFSAALADLFSASRPAATQQVLVQEFYRTVFASGVLDAQVNYAGLLSSLAASAPQYVTAVNAIVAPYYHRNLNPYNDNFGQSIGAFLFNAIGDNGTIIGGLGGNTINANSDALGNFYNSMTVYGNAGTNNIAAGPYGIDKIYGGTGADSVFEFGALPAGTIIDGGTGNNTLVLWGSDTTFKTLTSDNNSSPPDTRLATITNFQNLVLNQDAKLSASQLNQFTTINPASTGNIKKIIATDAGTYSLAGKTTASINLTAAGSTADITLIGSDQAAQVLTGGSGNTTLIAGNGAGDQLIGGSGTTVMTAGNGVGDILTAGNGNTTMNGGSGGDTFNTIISATGNYIMNGGVGNDTFNLTNSSFTGSISGGGGSDTVIASVINPGLSISGVRTLQTTAQVTQFNITADQLSGFQNIVVTGGALTFYARNAGTYDISAKTSTGTIGFCATAATGGPVTFIGNNQAGQFFRAGAVATTMKAGSGGAMMYDWTGVVTMIGGTGNDTFILTYGVAGDSITGGGGSDTLVFNSGGSLANMTISGVANLVANNNVTLNNAEFNGFTNFTAGTSGTATVTLSVVDAGAYDMRSKTVLGNFNLNSSGTSANVTLIGTDQAGLQLTGGSGVTTLTAGNGASDILRAGSGATNMTVGGGANDLIFAGSGNSTITVGNGNGDVIHGSTLGATTMNIGTGNDTMYGGHGYTTYNFGAIFGQDVIFNSYNTTTAQGEIDFASGITKNNLWFVKSGTDLIIEKLGTTSQVKLTSWFSNAGWQVQSINAGGLHLDAQVTQLVNAMATYATGHSTFNPTTATAMPTDTTLQGVMAAAWHA